MKKILSICILFLTISSSIYAALPPFAQSKKEIIAILNSEELSQYFDASDMIKSIKHYDTSYTISSDNKEVIVDVLYTSSERKIGPLEFKLLFHPANLQKN